MDLSTVKDSFKDRWYIIWKLNGMEDTNVHLGKSHDVSSHCFHFAVGNVLLCLLHAILSQDKCKKKVCIVEMQF